MAIHVTSEIGQLKKVLLHRPGKELEHLVPDELSRLLFDDIPYLKVAQQEHDFFADILRKNGTEVVYLEDLVAETLRQSEELKANFVAQFIEEGGSMAQRYKKELTQLLLDIEDEREMVLKTMAGVTISEISHGVENSPLTALTRNKDHFVLDPIPNLYYQRDPFASIGNGASVHAMYSVTRRRETLYGDYVLRNHKDFALQVPFYYHRSEPFSLEGGDVLNLTSEVLAVGVSQRTMPEGVEALANNIFADETAKIKKILAVEIPSVRAFMHLDTVFTQVDHDKFTVFPGILDGLRIFELTAGDRKGTLKVAERGNDFAGALRDNMPVDDVTLIHCGGKDRAASEREQWNDGANTLCVSPGKIVVYDRNYVTNEILRDQGLTVLEMPSSELSRGRGGPRCMSMPLWREDI
ncbi:MAG: arginine deiminase [Oscillospiraceae bacterium]|nr:arginine deiminase [Oscillospiraceae bacterium]